MKNSDLYKLTLKQASDLLSKGEVTSEELVKSSLDRIKQVEDDVNAFVSVEENYANHCLNNLNTVKNNDIFGIPAGIKDNICIDGLKTTCSSKILEPFIAPYSATVAKKLLDNGAIIMGKMNMDEFAMGSSTENSAIKITKNPWDIGYVPGGSSGGSAASVASGEVYYALGSDTGGSIRQPASFCGVVGMKPTYGTVSRFGLVAFASSLDQIGPLTRTVEDNAIVLDAITGYDQNDSTSINQEYSSFTANLNQDIKGMTIGIMPESLDGNIQPEVKEAMLNAIEIYKEMGATIKEVSLPYSNDYALATYYLIACAEASSNLARYDGIKYGYRSETFDNLVDLYAQSRSQGFGTEVKRRILLGTYALSSGYYDAYYLKAQKVRTLIKNSYEEAFKECDAILTPTAPTTAFRVKEKIVDPMQMYLSDIFTVPINLAGIPAISIPAGFDHQDMPIGIQLAGPFFSEAKLYQLAHQFEQNVSLKYNASWDKED